MSIATKTGDQGTTGLMYNRRVPKSHPRVEACGCVDELNAALGLARATTQEEFISEHVLAIQKDLVVLMGELATETVDLPRYERDGFPRVPLDMTDKLDHLVEDIESQQLTFAGWAMPGANLPSAALELARTVCRRAERRASALQELGQLENRFILIYLNRLSDALWLMARWAESHSPGPPPASVQR